MNPRLSCGAAQCQERARARGRAGHGAAAGRPEPQPSTDPCDPSGNAIEIEVFADVDTLFGKQAARPPRQAAAG